MLAWLAGNACFVSFIGAAEKVIVTHDFAVPLSENMP
jgi:hypothetical protein